MDKNIYLLYFIYISILPSTAKGKQTETKNQSIFNDNSSEKKYFKSFFIEMMVMHVDIIVVNFFFGKGKNKFGGIFEFEHWVTFLCKL